MVHKATILADLLPTFEPLLLFGLLLLGLLLLLLLLLVELELLLLSLTNELI